MHRFRWVKGLSVLFAGMVVGSLVGCRPDVLPAAPPADEPAGTSHLDSLAPGVWMHTTYRDVEAFGRVRSNGLVVAAGREALLVDAGWSGDPVGVTDTLLAEIRRAAGVPVTRAVFSHYHDDSVAGADALRRSRIPTYATTLTAQHMVAEGWIPPDSLFDAASADTWTLAVGDQTVEVFYPGPGHTVDNVVVFVPQSGVLYTGCLVRPGDTASLGNTADADLGEWAVSVRRVRARYGDRASVVVPSHGAPGGPELLDHTVALVEAQGQKP